MPLLYDSLSHGKVSFGFFNIKSDIMLLETYFFFAEDFCKIIEEIAKTESEQIISKQFDVYEISDSSRIGDLIGAIHGISYTGFIGRLYQLFPFPSDPKEFKQDPDGFLTRNKVLEILKEFGKGSSIPFEFHHPSSTVRIGRYLFDRGQFHGLLNYVWVGGYPRWKDEKRPAYVLKMAQASLGSQNPIFKGLEYLPALPCHLH
jgi:hypothetical protein